MPPLRISLSTVLAIVAVVALGLAGMVSASRLATAAMGTVTLALLLAAILAAWLRAGSDRAFWVGFALFGWTYLVLVNSDWVGGQFGHDLTAGLSDVGEVMVPEVQVLSVATPVPGARAVPTQPAIDWAEMMRQRQMKIGNFVQIARMLLSLCFALAGGFLARRIAERHGLRSGSPRPAAPG
jgi:hypothetical protein